jgi:ABC-type glycerol-3-phosphate transport system permease component
MGRIRIVPRRVPSFMVRQLIFIVLSVIALFPLYFMITTAFKPKMEFARNVVGLPIHFTLENFAMVVERKDFLQWFLNSVLLVSTSVPIAMFFSSLAAYPLSRMRFVGKRLIYILMITLQTVPVIVAIVPLFVVMVRTHLINTYPAAIITYTGFMIPYTTFLLIGFFKDVPQSLVDAAKIDGCSSFRVYWNILIPLSAPALVTLAIVNSLWVWNELLIALVFLQSDKMKTLMAGLTVFRSRFQINVPATSAGLVIAITPMILLYIFGQRYFIRGLIAGSLKGESE